MYSSDLEDIKVEHKTRDTPKNVTGGLRTAWNVAAGRSSLPEIMAGSDKHKLVLFQVVSSDRMIRQCDFLWRSYFYVDSPSIGVEKTRARLFYDSFTTLYVLFYGNRYLIAYVFC